MKTKSTESFPGNTREKQTMTRGKALKKAAKITLAAGTMMVLLNRPEKALAGSGGSGPSGSTLNNFTGGSDW